MEEFRVDDPYRAIELMENDPLQLVPEIMYLRGYARAYQAWNGAQGEHDADRRNQLMSESETVRLVIEHEFDLARERRAAALKKRSKT